MWRVQSRFTARLLSAVRQSLHNPRIYHKTGGQYMKDLQRNFVPDKLNSVPDRRPDEHPQCHHPTQQAQLQQCNSLSHLEAEHRVCRGDVPILQELRGRWLRQSHLG